MKQTVTETITKEGILQKWKERAIPENFLWGCQAKINYDVIKNNTPNQAKIILKQDYEKYKEMSLSSFILEAIEDVEQMEELDL